VIVEVAGCGVCHTDVGFAFDGVPTRAPLPLTLGHEISGRIVAAGESATEWEGRNVIVPAVIPCGDCSPCRAGQQTICRQQFMPGNDGDGGFATHVRVPARELCPVPEELPTGITLDLLSVVADAVTTPFEAIRRSGLGADDVAAFVGVGGVGGFGVQIAAALGASVIAIDVDPARLELAAQHGASLTLDASSANEKELKSAVRSFVKQSGRRRIGLKIFETSGTPAGQTIAFGLLDYGGYLAVVGLTSKKVESSSEVLTRPRSAISLSSLVFGTSVVSLSNTMNCLVKPPMKPYAEHTRQLEHPHPFVKVRDRLIANGLLMRPRLRLKQLPEAFHASDCLASKVVKVQAYTKL